MIQYKTSSSFLLYNEVHMLGSQFVNANRFICTHGQQNSIGVRITSSGVKLPGVKILVFSSLAVCPEQLT